MDTKGRRNTFEKLTHSNFAERLPAMQSTHLYNKRLQNPWNKRLLYLKDLQLLQSDFLTLTVFSGQMDGLQHKARVYNRKRLIHFIVKNILLGVKTLSTQGPLQTLYLCQWTGHRRCRPQPPLCPPAVCWTCSGHPLWPGGGALQVAAHFSKTVRKYNYFNFIIRKSEALKQYMFH